jgi:hypothetical protein
MVLPEFEWTNDTLPDALHKDAGGASLQSGSFGDGQRLGIMFKKIWFIIKLALVFAVIVLFGKMIQYLIFNGGFSGSFYDLIFFRS